MSSLTKTLLTSILCLVGAASCDGCDEALQPARCPVIAVVCGASNIGDCRQGTSLCNPLTGEFGPCEGAYYGAVESCDGRDNDCDGTTDNIDRASTVCGAGVGDCGPNIWGCSDGTSVCLPVGTPSEEECDGRDNDCDGETDEGLVRVCYTGGVGTVGVGACVAGFHVCSHGTWGQCYGEVVPSAETPCDDIDSDCDGQEVSSCLCGKEATPEVCNGIDDDCNGETDEGVKNACGTCEEVVELPCDKLDNDCDGLTDEEDAELISVVIAVDSSGSMGDNRLATIKSQLDSVLVRLFLDCPCNLYTVVQFPEPNNGGYKNDLLIDGDAEDARNVISGISMGVGSYEYSYDLVLEYANPAILIVIADEDGQSAYGITEASLVGETSGRVITFSDVPTDYDAFGQAVLLSGGAPVAQAYDFVAGYCTQP